MKVWTVVACVCVVAVMSIGCTARTRYTVLTFFFDGVPPPRAAEAPAAAGKQVAILANAAPPRRAGYREHGPYAARLCTACHESVATNTLVAPREQLCIRCHEFKMNKRYIHGPLASGGCTACHDPHSSQYRYLLVSESDSFCFHCHDRQTVARIGAHGGIEEQCTDCHDAHMSDKKYLLR
jgi:predicted CXXCH cytochrome family protein